MLFVAGLDTIASTYKRTVPKNQAQDKYPPESTTGKSYLSVHLSALISESSERSGKCWVSILKDGKKDGNPRIAIPSTIVSVLKENKVAWSSYVKKPKVPATWVICWLYDIYPDTTVDGWEKFEVSHRCKMNTCVHYKHLVWENKSENQSRGNNFCRRKCAHDDCESLNVCKCQGFHKPHCL